MLHADKIKRVELRWLHAGGTVEQLGLQGRRTAGGGGKFREIWRGWGGSERECAFPHMIRQDGC